MKSSLIALAVVAGVAGSASAQSILSFGFTDLSGSYNAGTSTYTALGVSNSLLNTAGNVNRHLSPVATAQYDPGTAAGLVGITLNVTNIVGNSANGAGTLFIEDNDGDRFVADVTGDFSMIAPAIFFNAALSNIAFVPGRASNNMFDGPSGGSFPLTFAPAQPPFTGATMLLFFDTPGAFFSQSFTGTGTQFHGAVVPSPAAGALLGLGGALVATRPRRR